MRVIITVEVEEKSLEDQQQYAITQRRTVYKQEIERAEEPTYLIARIANVVNGPVT